MKLIQKYKQLFAKEKRNTIILAVCLLVLPFWFTTMPELIKFEYRASFFDYYASRYVVLFIGYVMILLIYLFLTLVVRKLSISTFIVGTICFLGGYTNHYKLFYRSEPIVPTDILQVKDAITTASKTNLAFPFSPAMYVTMVLIIVISALLWFVRLPRFMLSGKLLKKILVNVAAVVLAIALLVSAFAFWITDDDAMKNMGFSFHPAIVRMYEINSFFPSFFYAMRDLFPKNPSGYSAAKLSEVGAEIQAGKLATTRHADIITVVVESWFELSNYDATYDVDLLENYHRLSAEGISGNIVSPKYGGGTADVEFEVLTGFSISDMRNANAFSVSLYAEFPGITNYLKAKGYGTYSVHSYTSELYNRTNAYHDLGFNESYFMKDFDNPVMAGPWISEDACVDKVIEVYKQSIQTDDHVMIHTLTMQNHTPMAHDRYNWNSPIKVHSSQTGTLYWDIMPTAAASYYEVDQAIGKLADYLRTVDRDVILIVLGDHQIPLIGSEEGDVLTEMGFFDSYDESRDFLKLHTTPYLVWTNTDTEHAGETFGNIPPNMLLPNALSAYQQDRPAYFDYFVQKTTTMNGFSSNFVVNLDGSVAFDKTAAQQSEADARTLVQYDVINGKKYLLDYLY